ncbi:hypothetical protein RQP54_18310 [Curvibacter sp. APW13]|uniref:hypothetical protein n=1 Tax=Curvibacter sp. APW13 TaxID=3077236 RepID=UPI0028DD821D|nr:hypothetical protein [Curvibacter sp. APW13]MDT8992833.1 hypothetical protein [Curvibacter sp. APW13]
MNQSEISVGKVYTNVTSENRRVIEILTMEDGKQMVRFQAMPWTMNPDLYLKHFKHLAPLPSPTEFRNKSRIAPGVLYGEVPLLAFARWAKQERTPNPKLNAPGRTMAAQIIEIVMRKQYTSRSAERTFYSECSTREQFFTPGPSAMHWVYTMPDGSRIGFMAPVVMAELDDMGKPILTSHHQLDLNQSFAFGDIERITRAEEKLWIEANRPFA